MRFLLLVALLLHSVAALSLATPSPPTATESEKARLSPRGDSGVDSAPAGVAAGNKSHPPPAIPAKAWAVFDYDSAQLLAGANTRQRLPPASLTKLMTAYVAFEAIKSKQIRLNDRVLISKRAWRQGYFTRESRMFLEYGSHVTVSELLRGLLVQSGNDASVALAEHISGTEPAFASRMNASAKALGLTDSHFTNPNGIHHPDLYTSARDLGRLARALIHDFPEHYALFSETEFTYNKITQRNRNRLLARDPSVDGLKTGHHKAAGYCMVTSAMRDGRRIISVVLGAQTPPQRVHSSALLLDYGFRFFETVHAAAAGQALTEIRVWKGMQNELSLGVTQPLTLSLPRGSRATLTMRSNVPLPVVAPVQAGQKLGRLEVLLGGKLIRSEPLVALTSVLAGGLWRRWSDALRLRWNLT